MRAASALSTHGAIAHAAGGTETLDHDEIARRIEQLRQEHRDLDLAIECDGADARADQLVLARIKKRKLRLRDEIAQLEDQLIPDIIA